MLKWFVNEMAVQVHSVLISGLSFCQHADGLLDENVNVEDSLAMMCGCWC